jgi:hypothetical protein
MILNARQTHFAVQFGLLPVTFIVLPSAWRAFSRLSSFVSHETRVLHDYNLYWQVNWYTLNFLDVGGLGTGYTVVGGKSHVLLSLHRTNKQISRLRGSG